MLVLWIPVAYYLGWLRGRMGLPVLWKSVPRETKPSPPPSVSSKPVVVLPDGEVDAMRTRLTEQVPGFATMPPNRQNAVLARLTQRAQDELGVRTG